MIDYKSQILKSKFFLNNRVLSHPLFQQIFLFLLVGGFCYLVSIVLLVLLVEYASMEVNLANLIASLIAIYVAYLLNAKFIFEKGKHDPKKELTIFFLFSFVGLAINVLLMFLMTTFLPISYIISKTIVTILVAGFNFVTRKFIVFNG